MPFGYSDARRPSLHGGGVLAPLPPLYERGIHTLSSAQHYAGVWKVGDCPDNRVDLLDVGVGGIYTTREWGFSE